MPSIGLTHGMTEIATDLRLHYVTAGTGQRTVVLLHGFPQTWWAWRHVLPPLVDAGLRVVALDYRGAGRSWRPREGYDKCTMAHDLSRLLRDHLRITHPVILVGHDIGLMIAYAYAQAYRDAVSHLAIIDAPLPGTSVFERVRASPRVWHFAFHNAHDIAEVLVAGRERLYLQAFFDARVFNPSAIEDGDLDRYTAAYSAPGAMRAAFELYRAFERDGADNQDALRRNGKLVIPVLAAWGAISNSGPVLRDMMEEVANDVTGVEIANAGHWIPEENPGALVAALLNLLSRA
jgi:pimeloyl-ACP methyl ester carboxylesterase